MYLQIKWEWIVRSWKYDRDNFYLYFSHLWVLQDLGYTDCPKRCDLMFIEFSGIFSVLFCHKDFLTAFEKSKRYFQLFVSYNSVGCLIFLLWNFLFKVLWFFCLRKINFKKLLISNLFNFYFFKLKLGKKNAQRLYIR